MNCRSTPSSSEIHIYIIAPPLIVTLLVCRAIAYESNQIKILILNHTTLTARVISLAFNQV